MEATLGFIYLGNLSFLSVNGELCWSSPTRWCCCSGILENVLCVHGELCVRLRCGLPVPADENLEIAVRCVDGVGGRCMSSQKTQHVAECFCCFSSLAAFSLRCFIHLRGKVGKGTPFHAEGTRGQGRAVFLMELLPLKPDVLALGNGSDDEYSPSWRGTYGGCGWGPTYVPPLLCNRK